ncbi:MAG TPA: ABC transporter permease [Spirochaetia bacterium]|nr:ABC transporter permease [Spirochaetia bacterium]
MHTVWDAVKRTLAITEVNRTILLLLITLVIYLVNPFFYTKPNLKLIMVWGSIFSLMVLGQMLYLIPGGMDLAFGGVICIVNILAAILIKNFHVNTYLAVIMVLALGALIGLATGLFANYFSPPFRYILPVFIFTLMLSFVLTGFGRIITQAFPVYGLGAAYSQISRTMIGPIPIVFIYLIVVFAIFLFFFYLRPFGWRLYAVGLDDVVAKKAGVLVPRVRLIACAVGSLIQAFSAILIGSYLDVGSVQIGPAYLLNIIAGAFIGGISLAGGEGSPFGAILGGFTVYLIENIIVILNVSAFWKEVVIGLFLIFFVVFEFYRRRRAASVLL